MRDLLSAHFVFEGRIGRGRYWGLSILYTVAFAAGMAAFLALRIVLDAKESSVVLLVLLPLMLIFFMAVSVAIVSIGVRRLHDRGRSGYWLLLHYAIPSMITKSAGLTGAGLVFSLLAIIAIV